MFKPLSSVQDSGEREAILHKQRELTAQIWDFLIPTNKQYGVYYEIHSFHEDFQQEMADIVPDIRKYFRYDTCIEWITDMKNVIYRTSKKENYRFINRGSGESLYLAIDNIRCLMYWSFSQ